MQKPYQNMTNEDRWKQYTPTCWCKRGRREEMMKIHLTVIQNSSDKVKKILTGDKNISYGDTERQTLDVFYTDTTPEDAPIFVFIHGGYWQAMRFDNWSKVSLDLFIVLADCQHIRLDNSKESYWGQAMPVVQAGAVHVFIEYDLAPGVNLDTIVAQVKTATKQVLELAKKRGSRGVYLTGHSAGGHLVAMILSSDWADEDIALIKGAVLQSGVFDLRPLVDHPTVGVSMKLTEDEAVRNSPELYINKLCSQCQHMKLMAVVGEYDTPEFKRQSMEFSKLLTQGGAVCQYKVIEGRDHFDLMEDLVNPDFELTKIQLAMMGLGH